MSMKKKPASLYNLTASQVTKNLLKQWRETYYTNYAQYSEEFKEMVGTLMPHTIYNQLFDLMIDSHARVIQNEGGCDIIPSIACLIDSIIIPNLRKLNLNCLRHMGTVKDEEIRYLENILTSELPNLNNLVEISLQTCGTDFTLPTCNDEIMEQIGISCLHLKSLDISYNHTVTDKGLASIVPSDLRKGCPLLTKVSLFECSVTPEGIVMLLKGLSHLKFLGYRETGQALLLLNRHLPPTEVFRLQLAHVNNLGTISRTCKDLYKLTCNQRLVNTMSTYCPKLNGLKVRVNDSDVKFLQEIKSVSILELVYNLGTPSSPGSFTIQYLSVCGTQLVSLSFVCDSFSTRYLKVVCEQCHNLKRLWLRSNNFICDTDITNSDKRKCSLANLEVFFFRVGWPGFEICRIPQSVINYVLHKSKSLNEIVFAMKNSLMCDSFIQDVFSGIYTANLKNVMILVPHKNLTLSSLNLSMSSIDIIIGLCPQLERLGNLLVWDVSLEEIQELKRQLKISNSALELVYRMMFS